MTQLTRGTWRSLAPVAAVAATALTGSLLVSAPAQSALPAGDCAVPFPVGELASGQPVNGLTVSQGTTPEVFTGEVLGVLNDGIAPGLDMVMMRLTSPEIDRVGSIWAGMSGSPVYAEDGRLIGAVAYGLSWGPSPVAGVTPFEEMDDYVVTPGPTVRVPVSAARKIAAATDVTVAQAVEGFDQLPMPLGVSGVSTSRLRDVKARDYLDAGSRAMGIAGSAGPTAETIVAGGNLALSVSYGEVTTAAVGTATSVCHDQVVGFGHPATFLGKIAAGLHPADAVYVQEDSVGGAFKVANLGDPVGTITDDHLTGITGTFGALPPTTPVTSTVTFGARSRTGSSAVEMESYLASTVYYQLVGNHDRVVDARMPGSEEQSWVITGTGPTGDPFTVDLTDRFTSQYDISDTASYPVADMAWYLSELPGVEVAGVTVDGTVSDDASTYAVKGVEVKQAGVWVVVPNHGRIKTTAGRTLKLRALLDSDTGTLKVPVSVDVPQRLAGQRGVLSVEGGSEQYTRYWNANTLEKFLNRVAKEVRNDAVAAHVYAEGETGEYHKTVVTDPTDKVVQGRKWFRLVVAP